MRAGREICDWTRERPGIEAQWHKYQLLGALTPSCKKGRCSVLKKARKTIQSQDLSCRKLVSGTVRARRLKCQLLAQFVLAEIKKQAGLPSSCKFTRWGNQRVTMASEGWCSEGARSWSKQNRTHQTPKHKKCSFLPPAESNLRGGFFYWQYFNFEL